MKSTIITALLLCISLAVESHQPNQRYYALADLAKAEVHRSASQARVFAKELLHLSTVEPKDWNFGNAVHFGNMVLGQVALREGDIDKAEEYLLKSGATEGSPQLNSFGPNMTLAKELLEANRPDAVLEYFDLCAKFWELSRGRLDEWRQQVTMGEVPDFGANLRY